MAGALKTGKYTVPKEIAVLKPKEIRCDIKVVETKTKNGIRKHYYVYEVINNKADKVIGKIEGGKFCPNARGLGRISQMNNGRAEDAQPKEMTPGHPAALSRDEEMCIESAAVNMNLSLKNIDFQIKDYGEYAAVLACSQSVLTRLESCFSDKDARLIYALSVIYFIQEYTPASYVKDVYDQSILSNKWPTLAISENKVGEFLKLLGRHPLVCEQYSQGLIDSSSGTIAIDGHVILTCSKLNDLADYGNKYQKIGNKQMNVLQAYDAVNEAPLTSKTYEGDVIDKVSVKDLFQAYEFPSGTTFLIDMGFYSEDNLGLYRENGNYFVIPVAESATIGKAIRSPISFDGSFSYTKRDGSGNAYEDTILYKESTVHELEDLYQKKLDEEAERKNREAQEKCRPGTKLKKIYPRKITRSRFGNDRVIVFRDEDMHNKMVAEYLSQIGMDETHTEEKLSQLGPEFGVIVLRTNKSVEMASASVCYCDYKKRWTIETHYNFVKNAINFCGLQECDYYSMEGLSFLMITVGQVKTSFLKKLKSSKERYVRNMSIAEALAKAGRIKVSQHQDKQWYFSYASKKKMILMQELGVDIGGDSKKLNISQL